VWLRAAKVQKGMLLIEAGHCLAGLRAGVLAGLRELHSWLQGALLCVCAEHVLCEMWLCSAKGIVPLQRQ